MKKRGVVEPVSQEPSGYTLVRWGWGGTSPTPESGLWAAYTPGLRAASWALITFHFMIFFLSL